MNQDAYPRWAQWGEEMRESLARGQQTMCLTGGRARGLRLQGMNKSRHPYRFPVATSASRAFESECAECGLMPVPTALAISACTAAASQGLLRA